jgi:2-hydroxychromene-2-carboxylate isomerase
MDLLPGYEGVEIEWRPVESHPRPEDHPPHTDLCVQSYYIARELGADMKAFFAAMFQGVAAERQDVEKPEVLGSILKNVLDTSKFLSLLKSGKYAPKVDENNDLAYEKKGVWYVPAFRALETAGADLPALDAKGGVGVSREEVREFLDQLTKK